MIEHVAERFAYVPLYARVDMVAGPDGSPVLMELEAVEPNLYLDQARGRPSASRRDRRQGRLVAAPSIAVSIAAAMRSATAG